jgi:hypothetical protein
MLNVPDGKLPCSSISILSGARSQMYFRGRAVRTESWVSEGSHNTINFDGLYCLNSVGYGEAYTLYMIYDLLYIMIYIYYIVHILYYIVYIYIYITILYTYLLVCTHALWSKHHLFFFKISDMCSTMVGWFDPVRSPWHQWPMNIYGWLMVLSG